MFFFVKRWDHFCENRQEHELLTPRSDQNQWICQFAICFMELASYSQAGASQSAINWPAKVRECAHLS